MLIGAVWGRCDAVLTATAAAVGSAATESCRSATHSSDIAPLGSLRVGRSVAGGAVP